MAETADSEVEERLENEVEERLENEMEEGLENAGVEKEGPPEKESLEKPGGVLNNVPPKEEGEPQHIVEEAPHPSKKSGEREKVPKKKKFFPVLGLFRFADGWDIVMILLGLLTAILSGLALPGHMVLFGRVINNFVHYSTATNQTSDVGGSISENVRNAASRFGLSCEEFVEENSTYLFEELFENSMEERMLLCDNIEQGIFSDVVRYSCDSDARLRYRVGVFSLIYVGIGCVTLLAVFLSTIFWNVSAYRQTKRMRRAFYRSILHQEIGWFDVTEASELSTRLADDIEKVQAGIGDKLALFLNYFTTFVAGFIIALAFNWKLALVVSVMLPLLTFMAASVAKIIATFTVREQSAYAAAGAVAEEVISSIKTVVAFGGEKREVQRYDVQLHRARKEGYKKGFFSSIVFGMLYMIIFSTFALGFWFGSTLVASCELSAGDVVTVFFAVILGSFSLGNALPELFTFGTALGSASIIFQVIDREPVIDASSEEGLKPDKLKGNIKFSGVKFNYPARPDVQVMKGLDLEILPGQTVALVGPSGCGKSTVVQLIQRFYNPDEGQITLDGNEISSLNLQWLRAHVGVVSQEPVLFDTTITENIRFGRQDATLQDVMEAARKANAHDFISSLPEGYETDVGERGAQLSGGQKQRIAIARALIRDPKVLLLDEATSALDTESEKVVQEALDKAREGRTTIIIAHRLSTIQNADVIISIEDGHVAEKGSHAELMDKGGLYHNLVTAQTIVEEEDPSSEGLAGFKAAVKRSAQRSDSYTKQVSYVSQHSVRRDESVFSFSDHFTNEDIPIAAAPSPFPGRRTFPGSEEAVARDEEQAVELREEMGSPVEEEEEGVQVESNKHSFAVKHLLKRRRKAAGGQVRNTTFKELLLLNKPDWYLVVIGVVLSAIIGIIFPVQAVLFGEFLRIFGLSSADEIRRGSEIIAGGFVALAALSAVVNFLGGFTLAIAGENLTKRLRHRSFQAILKQEINWFDEKAHSTGALTTRLATDAAEVKGATGIRLGIVVQTVCGLIAAIVIAFEASWELSFVMVLAFPFLGSVAFLQVRLLAGRAQKNKKRFEKSGQTAVESIDNIRTVVGLGLEDYFLDKYNNLLTGPFKDSMKSVFLQAVVLSLSQSLIFYLYAGGFSFGAFLVIERRASYDDIFQVFAAVVFTAFTLGRATSFAPDATKAKVSASRILALLDRKPLIDSSSTEGQKLDVTSGDIAVKSVHFNYPARPEVNVLQGIDLLVQPGQTLALVGPSGCGKSTVVALLERFYDPVLGSLMLEGVDLRDLNLQWLRSQIGIVSQEPVLFDTSIADNIRYGALFRDVTDDEVIEAAKSANIHPFIESLPEGYSTNVGAKGTQLSGGQKQRIAIARALIRDPKVLLLDEATSALDTESEKVVQEALDKAREGRTSIVIAHRLSTIYNSDVIAVIHNGRVLESGTHSQLMALRGAYYLLNTVQLQDVETIAAREGRGGGGEGTGGGEETSGGEGTGGGEEEGPAGKSN